MQRQKRTSSSTRSRSTSQRVASPTRAVSSTSATVSLLRTSSMPMASHSSPSSSSTSVHRATTSQSSTRTSSSVQSRRAVSTSSLLSSPFSMGHFRSSPAVPTARPSITRTAAVPSFAPPSTFTPTFSMDHSSTVFTTPMRMMAKKAGKEKGGGKSKGDKSSGSDASPAEFSKDQFVEKMQACVAAYANELNNIKVGRATPEMLHDILIDYQMKKVPLKSISQIYTKPPASLVVSLHEHTDLLDKTVCTAISNAGMDLAPISETVHGMPAIVVPFPKPTRELRDQLIKQAKAKAEETKVNIRHVRKLWNDGIKKAKLPKDDAHRAEGECQKHTDKYCDEVTDMANKKEKEINNA